MVKRIYFFANGTCYQYDPRPSADHVVKSSQIGNRFKGLKTGFQNRIDAAFNRGDGTICLFRDNECWDYDALKNSAAGASPSEIATVFPDFPAKFKEGIDAAFNTGTGKAYFFKGDRYLRYHVLDKRVDDPDLGTSPYPRKISDPNGWHGLTPDFAAGLNAAVYAGDDKLYFFKGTQYARLTYSTRSVDLIDPPYPRPISLAWVGLPPQIGGAVEWIQAGTATLAITKSAPQHIPVSILSGVMRQPFTMSARIEATGYPSLCACAEYRQYVRGFYKLDGLKIPHPLVNPVGGPPIDLLDRPSPGSTDDHFREDSLPVDSPPPPFYGHRDAVDTGNTYLPDAITGCRYEGNDAPYLVARLGQSAEINLDFRGVVIDVAADDEMLVEQKWTVWVPGPI